VSPVQDHSAADAVPIGLIAARARCNGDLFGARVFRATPEPLLLFRAPLTTLTATSEPDGLEPPLDVDLELEQATAPHARSTDATYGRAWEWIMVISFS
jgi:hypothetical protein